MSGKSSKTAAWWSELEPTPTGVFFGRGDPDDPRLGEVVGRWSGGKVVIKPGQPIIIGFPCDEGVRRNGGRVGAAQAPNAIREQLYRQTSWDGMAKVDFSNLALLDLGNVRLGPELESSQERLGRVIAGLLHEGAVPIVIGGGHETAYGHYLGYAGIDVGIINVDAHLDVRQYPNGGHSGSPFRQAMEHPQHPLKKGGYVVIGAQSLSVAKAHEEYVAQQSGRVHWLDDRLDLTEWVKLFSAELNRLADACAAVIVTVDADAFRQADVPGSSSPSPIGIDGVAWLHIALRAGAHPLVRSLEIVEVNPLHDRDQQSTRWAALGIRQFLIGLASRNP